MKKLIKILCVACGLIWLWDVYKLCFLDYQLSRYDSIVASLITAAFFLFSKVEVTKGSDKQ